MLFNSIQFLFFFPIVTIIYFLLPHRYRWFHLLVASCIFYCAFIPIYILILIFTIIIDYYAGILIEKSGGNRRKLFLIASICANIGVLSFFKYYNFFIDNFQTLFTYFHSTFPLPLLNIILPIGLSFHTFQAMSYTIEVYRGNQKAERHFGIYALYVMFYPQLVAGPIERPQNLLHQFKEEHHFDYQRIINGLRLMAWGLFKKMVIADNLASFVNIVYGSPHNFSGAPILISIIFFSIQLYCDFSGYSDIALGSAQVMGFTLMKNFDRPFFSTNITELWRRWHISLSTWLRDYLYTPISVATRNWGQMGIAFSLIVTFLIAGLWHGPSWKFAFFGLLHGIALTYEFFTRKIRKRLAKKISSVIYVNLSIVLTFMYFSFAAIFFRADSFGDAFYLITHLFRASSSIQRSATYHGISSIKVWFQTIDLFLVPFLIAILWLFDILQNYTNPIESLSKRPFWQRWVIYYFFVIAILLLGNHSNTQFIYFQF